MRVEFVHQMPNVKDAYRAVIGVDPETNELIHGSGIILLIGRDGCTDWYFYVDLIDPTVEERRRILAIMDKAGTRTDQRIEDLLLNPNFSECFSGDAERIATSLGRLVRS